MHLEIPAVADSSIPDVINPPEPDIQTA